MKARMLAMLVLLGAVSISQVRVGQASVEPIFAVDSFFAALNRGDTEAAVAAFTPDAVATLQRGESYSGPGGIGSMVELMEHAGRRYEIVEVTMVGGTVTMVVDVSDDGIRWGQQTLVAEVQDGKLHTLREKVFQLRLGS